MPGEQGEPEARGVRGMPGAPWAHWECKACRERPGSGVAGGEEVFRERGPAGVDRASSLGGQAGPGQWGRERARPPEAGPAIAPSLLHGDGFEGLVSSVKKKSTGSFRYWKEAARVARGWSHAPAGTWTLVPPCEGVLGRQDRAGLRVWVRMAPGSPLEPEASSAEALRAQAVLEV